MSFNGVTIQNGFNNGAGFVGSFFETGGGIDFFLTGTGNNYSMTNCVVTNNRAIGSTLSHGGGINIDSAGSATPAGPSAGTVTLTNVTVSNNTAATFGGGVNLAADKHDVTMTNCVVTGNTAQTQDGGGIWIRHSFGGTVNINGASGLVSNNSGTQGGGISNTGNQITNINDITISNNTATGTGSSSAGGGISIAQLGALNVAGSTTLTNLTISGNHADNGPEARGGGVAFAQNYTTTITNCTVSGNTAKLGAGIVNQGSNGTPANVLGISGGSIRGNIATGDGVSTGFGGAFASRGGSDGNGNPASVTTFTNVAIGGSTAGQGNSAVHGGGIANMTMSATTIGGTSTIYGNIASGSGGGILETGTGTSAVTLNNGVPVGGASAGQGNTAANGGGIAVDAGALNFNSGSLIGNKATNNGGGLHVSDGPSATAASVTLSGIPIQRNQADSDLSNTGDGGGVYHSGGTLNFTAPIVIGGSGAGEGNSARTGGGIAIAGGTQSITGGYIVANTATANGAGVAISAGTWTAKNLTISGNLANGAGGGLFNSGTGAPTLTNVTISNNRSDANNIGGETGGGLGRTAGSVTLQNTLIGGNFRGTGATADDLNGSVTANNSLVADATGASLTGSANLTGQNARLGPLQNNGGSTLTHQLLGGSPALDAGNNTFASGLTTDQRGTGFPRLLDAGDADLTDEVDIGAYEAHPAVDDVLDQNTNEDTAKSVTVNFGDADLPITNFTATSSNTTLVPNANIAISGSGASRSLNITPVANLFGTTTITVTVSGTENALAFNSSDTFVLTVNPIADTPSATGATTLEDTQSASGLVLSRNAVDGAEVTHFKITGITNGTLFKNDGTTVISNNSFITFAEGNAGLKFTPSANLNTPAGDLFGFTVQAAVDSIGTGISPSIAVAVTVSEVNDPPVATDDALSSVLEDSGVRAITIASLLTNDSKGPANESAQTLTITGVSNAIGGTVAINGSNVEFTPTADFNGTASFDYTLQDNGTTAGAANAKTDVGAVSFTVTAVNDKPTFTASNPSTVNEDAGAQTVSGWVTNFNPGPANESTQTVVAYTVSNVSNPGLFSAGPAVATNGNLTYTPAADANGTSTFEVKVQDNGGIANGGVDTSDLQMFTITVNPVNDAPTLNSISNPAAIPEDSGQQTVNLAGISSGPANESGQTLTVTASSSNTAVIPDPTVTYTSPNATGSLAYTPVANASGSVVITVTVKDNGGTSPGVDSFQRTFTVVVNPVNDAPTITGQMPVSTAFNTARTITFSDLQVNDIDNTYPTGFTLTVMAGANYSLAGNTVTPANNFFGTLTVPVKINDGGLDSNTFQLAMTVNPDPIAVKNGAKITKDVSGGYRIDFIGNPGQQYTVQFNPGLVPANWQFLGLRVADAQGMFFIIDMPPAGTTERFYRAIVP